MEPEELAELSKEPSKPSVRGGDAVVFVALRSIVIVRPPPSAILAFDAIALCLPGHHRTSLRISVGPL
jgi:hypothetical protein